MIIILPTFEVMKPVTDSNVTSAASSPRVNAFDKAMELASFEDVELKLEGNLYEKIRGRLTPDHEEFLKNVCLIDNSAKGCPDYNLDKSIEWVAKKDSEINHVIILSSRPAPAGVDANKVRVVSPERFIALAEDAEAIYNRFNGSLAQAAKITFFN